MSRNSRVHFGTQALVKIAEQVGRRRSDAVHENAENVIGRATVARPWAPAGILSGEGGHN
jgi:hypothetical protein